MNPVKIKFCGITNEKDARWAAGLGVDYMGFNFVPGSPRKISEAQAVKVISALPEFVRTVGVFVHPEIKQIKRVKKKLRLDLVQLHGGEPPELCRGIGELGIQIIKAFRLASAEDIEKLSAFADVSDYFLLDTFVPGEAGGTGRTFNWQWAIEAKRFGKPIFLAGGLNPENVLEAVERVSPYAVDVASGIEKSPRSKDYSKMKDLVFKLRGMY